ncbi:MAG: DNA cytosine methyltransferase [Acidobacteriota bacterium]|jgi:DNA (cytosine-5)-methyltransferase 1
MKGNKAQLLPFMRKQKAAQPTAAVRPRQLQVVGLFAGIGGVELGLASAGHQTSLLCEIEANAAAVLTQRFPKVPLHDDVTTLRSLPKGTDLLAGGFPCQDLSQAGKTEGILRGKRSSLVGEVFRLVKKHEPPLVLLENVPFMLKLDSGRAMEVLAAAFEELGYKWAYRVINSLAFGVPQRRERVIFLASKDVDPREVLFPGNEDEPASLLDAVGKVACGFYWTEGIRGLGWAADAVPTLKGGSTIGIPSPPAILMPDGRVVTPDIRDAERMQGFPEEWTAPAALVARDSSRWKLIGNAVTVDLFKWVGKNLASPSSDFDDQEAKRIRINHGWPKAGWNCGEGRFEAELSTYPCLTRRTPLHKWLRYPGKALSLRATKGFLLRTDHSSLRFPKRFLEMLRQHKEEAEAATHA